MSNLEALKTDDIVDVLNGDGKRLLWGALVSRDERITVIKQITPSASKPHWAFDLAEVPTNLFVFVRVPEASGEDGLLLRTARLFVDDLLYEYRIIHEGWSVEMLPSRKPGKDDLSQWAIKDIVRELVTRDPSRIKTLRSDSDDDDSWNHLLRTGAEVALMHPDTPAEAIRVFLVENLERLGGESRERFLANAEQLRCPHLELIRGVLKDLPAVPEPKVLTTAVSESDDEDEEDGDDSGADFVSGDEEGEDIY